MCNPNRDCICINDVAFFDTISLNYLAVGTAASMVVITHYMKPVPARSCENLLKIVDCVEAGLVDMERLSLDGFIHQWI